MSYDDPRDAGRLVDAYSRPLHPQYDPEATWNRFLEVTAPSDTRRVFVPGAPLADAEDAWFTHGTYRSTTYGSFRWATPTFCPEAPKGESHAWGDHVRGPRFQRHLHGRKCRRCGWIIWDDYPKRVGTP